MKSDKQVSEHSKRSFSITAESNIENDVDIGENPNNVSISRKKICNSEKKKRNAVNKSNESLTYS